MSKLLKFILKISFLTLLLIGTYLGVSYKITQSSVDINYSKFTHKGGSLIIGLSRANRGISPYVIENEFQNTINKPVLNFSFNKFNSSYGQVFLNAIKNKIDSTGNKGLFILSVSPGGFLMNKNITDYSNIDAYNILSKAKEFNKNPNFSYIRNCFDGSLYQFLMLKKQQPNIFHDNGWAEFKPEIKDTLLININKRKKFLNNFYSKFLDKEIISDYRIQKFKETIEFLKKHGQVVLVRIPADKDLIETENKYYPEFNDLMVSTAKNYNIPYFDYTKQDHNYKTYDGSHLFSESAIKFTEQLCKDIKKYQQQ